MSYNPSTAFLSDIVYNKEKVNSDAIGSQFTDATGNTWTLRDFSNNDQNGYQGAVFVNSKNQIVVVNRGTELTSLQDLASDLQMGLGALPSQYASAEELFGRASKIAREMGQTDGDILVTGHSLGGSLTQLVAANHAKDGVQAETYNPYGVGNLLEGLGIFGGTFDNIVNHVTEGDPVSVLPGSKMLGSTYAYTTDAEALWRDFSSRLGEALTSFYTKYLFDAHLIASFADAVLATQAGRLVTIDVPGTATVQSMLEAWGEQFGKNFLNVALGLSSSLTELIIGLQSKFAQAEATISPLVLDLDGDGVSTLSKTAGVHFDHDGNGFAEQTGWADAADGMLAFDRNGNGSIDSGAELFGNHTRLADGTLAANGFAALADFDSDQDGDVDSADADFGGLRVWRDLNSNGITENGELLTLQEAGVQSLSVSYTEANTSGTDGNLHKQVGSYTRSDGSVAGMDDVWFAVDTARTVDQDLVEVSAEIAALPEVAGFGNVHSLRQATNAYRWSLVA